MPIDPAIRPLLVALRAESRGKGRVLPDPPSNRSLSGTLRRYLEERSWRFMKDRPYKVNPEPYAGGIPAGFPTYCKIVP